MNFTERDKELSYEPPDGYSGKSELSLLAALITGNLGSSPNENIPTNLAAGGWGVERSFSAGRMRVFPRSTSSTDRTTSMGSRLG